MSETKKRRKCGDCVYRKEDKFNIIPKKRKVFRCYYGSYPHYRVGKNARCHRAYPFYEDYN